ncbi:diguanylate cyclase [Marinitoga sp. 1138]|uniref:diguanylate cyclase n=1 Tax=Marinitoga sp. 1138 TaxID=1643334 RepID=UPI001586C2AB|nr:diguanylate cyclase [Marinitoga sp. 1138]NUU98479.1 hypothetical protein [Marinitoga sp. 1138]
MDELTTYLNKNAFGIDYLKIIENKTYRVRKTSSDNFDNTLYYQIYNDIYSLKDFGVDLPVKIENTNGTYEIYFNYWNEVSITRKKLTENEFFEVLYTLYDLFDRITHATKWYVDYIYLEDIFIDELGNVSIILPFFETEEENEYIITSELDAEAGVIDILKKATLEIYNLLESKNKTVKDFIKEIKEYKFECVHDFYIILSNYYISKKIHPLKIPHFLDRVEERNFILENLKGNTHFYIYGKQRVGKTQLINFLTPKFKELGYEVIYAKNFKDIVPGLPETMTNSMNIFHFIEFLKALKGKNEDFKLIILIDDYQSTSTTFKNFIKTLILKEFDFPFSIFIISHEKFDFDNDKIKYLEIKPFSKEIATIFLKTILSSEFIKENPDFVEIVYSYSRGLPGNMFHIIKNFYEQNILEYKNEKWVFNIEKIKNRKIYDFILEQIKHIPEKYINCLKYISTLGFMFNSEELKTLSDFLNKDFKEVIDFAIEKGIILVEGKNYKFFNLVYQERLHQMLSQEEIENVHGYLLCKTKDIDKKIFHLVSMGKNKSAAALIIKEMKKKIFNWEDLNLIEIWFERLKDLVEDIPNSAIALYLTKKFFLNEYSQELEVYLDKLKNSKVYNYIYIIFFKFKNPDVAKEHFEFLINKKGIADYKKALYTYFYFYFKFDELKREEIYDYYLYLESYVFSKHHNLRKFQTLKGLLLNILALKMQKDLPDLALNYFNDALRIAKEIKYNRLLQVLYSNMASLYEVLNSPLNEYYFKKVLEISKSIGDFSSYNRTLVSIANTELYKGNVKDFFYLINKAEEYSRINNDYENLISIYELKNIYYLYGIDFSNLNTLIKSLNVLNKNYYLKERIENVINNIIILKAFYEHDFDTLKDEKLMEFIEKDDFYRHFYYLLKEDEEEKVYKHWLFFKNNPFLYLKEELINILAPKIAHYSFADEFEKWALSLEEELKEKKLSLTLIYEGLGYFYDIKRKKLKSLKYLRTAQMNYEMFFMKNKFDKINDYLTNKFNMPSFAFDFSDIEIEDETNRKIFEKLQNKINFYEKINELSLNLLKSNSPKYVINKIGNFLKNNFPVDTVFLKLKTDLYDVEYAFNAREPVMYKNDIFLLNPLTVSFKAEYKDFTYYIYFANKNIELEKSEANYILDSLIIIEQLLTSILDKIVHYENSIVDPLTSAFSRRYLENKLNELIGLNERYKFTFSIIMLDIDNFKRINDTYGHQKGDEVLIELVRSLKNNLRDFDIVCRYGGEEFIVILPNTSLNAAGKIAERLRIEVNRDLLDVTGLDITCSFGVSSIENIMKEPKAKHLIKNADDALYKAKNTGKNKVVISRGD